ncbi:P-loop containing nucleoside triphosphate hydrolase protein [Piromyces finnis]|uniref:p-loop containing nucleoside triphosphate hydrolase protein n=1 Tax=Piromyces finnis TaxID=1754191 RepID=A0A1Y1VMD1_9FUNG|nr:P-loop containing nucleoside triphosphate hydrolase protein [Piromyces finnis]|eukprot:ORX60084.1 P-loop containing nucleoside triphosphate hydrolase protein [Piromyces finnis]
MSLFLNQLKAVTYRNILIKKNNKKKTFQELFLPIYFVFFIFILRFTGKSVLYEAEDSREIGDISKFFLINPEQNTIGFVLPNNGNDEVISNVMMDPLLKENNYQYVRFNNEKELENYNDEHKNLFAGIIFEDNLFTYTIRINGTEVTDPEKAPIGNYGENRAGIVDTGYYKFSYLQSLVDSTIISIKTKKPISFKSTLGDLSKPPINYVGMNGMGPKLNSLYMNFIFLSHIIIIVTFIVEEKEKKIKEGMLMSGVNSSVFWLSWEIVYFVIIVFTALIITAFLVIVKSFEYINPIILFIIITLFGLSNCGIGFIFSTFFKKAKTAASFAGTTSTFICVAYLAISYLDRKLKLIFSFLISPVAMGNIMEEISKKEDIREYITFKTVFNSDIGLYILILLFNNILYFGLSILFEYLLDDYSTLRLKRSSSHNIINESDNNYEQDIEEDLRKNEKCLVEISNVSKQFEKKSENSNSKNKKEQFLAVNHVNFKVYKDEIFCILGHNGAGKTTLIQMMIGLINTSGGNIYYDGTDIAKNTTQIRRDFGVCPQTNILFDELTVSDHIKIFSMIKNVKVDINEILKEVDLEHKKDDKVINLSGGQKRKLCIAIAIIGNPKYIFLDEPTTGLDPLSRRKIWDLLSKKKMGRVIFLTTHYMDEADILADRKLILNHGKIRCLGTSVYLKNHFNMEYSLDIESNSCDQVDDIIKKYIPESKYIIDSEKQSKNTDVEMRTWKLPISSTSEFSNLFNEIESYAGENKLIKNYALTMPTLEELFIRLEDDHTEETPKENTGSDAFIINTNEGLPNLKEVQGLTNIQKIITLIKFRLKIFFHNKSFAVSALLTPVIITIITFILLKAMDNVQIVTFKPKEISPTMYNGSLWNVDTTQTNIPNFKELYGNMVGADALKSYSNEELNKIGKTVNKEPYYVSSVSGSLENDSYNFNIYLNTSMSHSLPATMNALSNTILASNNINERIVTKSHPFSYGNYVFVTAASVIIGIYIGAALLTGISLYGPLIVRERVNQLLQQLQLNGVSRFNYWISSLLTDASLTFVTSVCIVIVGIIFQPQVFLDVNVIIILLITNVLWSFATLIYQYVISFFFDKVDTANSFMALINLLPAYVGVIAFSLINNQYQSTDPNKMYSNTAIIVEIIFGLINPPYAIMGIFNALFTIQFLMKLLKLDLGFNYLLKFNSGITPLILVLVVDIIIYFILLLKCDARKNQSNASDIHTPTPESTEENKRLLQEGDEDVYNEYLNIKSNYNNLPISTLQISKDYRVSLPSNPEEKKIIKERTKYKFGDVHKSPYTRNTYVRTAVEDVSFGINKHECFGLLGPNGAGKSTTLNMITSTIPQTTGKIYYDGVESHIARYNNISLGYCPQNDTFWKELTIREHLEFFLKIRGYSDELAKEYTTQYIRSCGLEEHEGKHASKLSGGTKRKLCLLMAICGCPNQVLLDEPTAGMDPSTRRYIWNIIKETKKENNTAIIMTTHSMEEAEFLCDRLGILINGRLKCIGSPEHIKMKYGEGYNLEVQSKDIEAFHTKMIEEVGILGNVYKKEIKSHDRVNYEISIQKGIGKIFEAMEGCKASGLISDYTFSQTSLEQIFINFAKLQIINNDNSN